MPAVYDKWERLVTATLRREQLRETAMRTPSNLSSASSSSQSFNLGAYYGRVSSLSLLVGDSFPYRQILAATDLFHESKLIQHGHSGDFFAGVLDSGIEVVVKRVNVSSTEKRLNLQSEIDIYVMLNHSRMLPLMGHCLDYADERFLIYKLMPKGDLSRFLSPNIDRDRKPLDWTTRLKIAVGVAEGLCYLHHQCSPPLVHRDIQATSILLDDEFEVQLGSLMGVCYEEQDIDQNSSIARLLRLPKGFEQKKSGLSDATCAYDVYCFGKVLLELITGKLGPSAVNNSSMKGWLENTLRYIVFSDKAIIVKIADSSLNMNEHLLVEMWAVSFLAKACLSSKPSKRPKMAEIFKELEHLKLGKLTAAVDQLNLGSSSTLLNNRSLITASMSVNDYPNGKILAHSRNLRIFTVSELIHTTRDLPMEMWFDQDKSGKVYRGLLDNDLVLVIAIKRRILNDIEQLESEVDLLGRISHPNILSPFGYCCHPNINSPFGYCYDELLLVYEFMEGSLQKHLLGNYSTLFTWEKKLKVLTGAPRGLEFLHASVMKGLFPEKHHGGGLYGCFETSKIMIDSDYNAKITGFPVSEVGYSKFALDRRDGTYHYDSGVEECYAAPEFSVFGGRSLLESDVYGFGVLMMATLTGGDTYGYSFAAQFRGISKEIDLMLKAGNLEPRSVTTKPPFQRNFDTRAAALLVQLALSCVQREYMLRPSMHKVVQLLEGIEKMK